jgi:hypothetical protein
MNKVICISLSIVCFALLCVVGCKDSEKSDFEKSLAQTLLKGMSVKYWVFDLDPSFADKNAWLCAYVETRKGVVRRQKLLRLSETSAKRFVVAMQRQHDFNYVLFVNDLNGVTVNSRIGKEVFDSLFFMYNTEISLQPNVFIVKGGSEVNNDFSKLYREEIGIRLRVE